MEADRIAPSRTVAVRAFEQNYVEGRIGIKKLFYVLRPLLACRWIERHRTQPPTELQQLIATPSVTSAEREWIAGLLRAKAQAAEKDSIELDQERAQSIQSELVHYESAADRLQTAAKVATDELDAILRAWTR